jgi:alanyl-tRNA synthetase
LARRKLAEKLVGELKEANMEKKKLLKELAAKDASSDLSETGKTVVVEIDGLKLVKLDFHSEVDVNRMIQTASELIKKDAGTIVLSYGANENTARLTVMAGSTAVTKGVNAGEVLKVAAPIFGGGGGGRKDFAQGGGTQPEKLAVAVKQAEEVIKKQLYH